MWPLGKSLINDDTEQKNPHKSTISNIGLLWERKKFKIALGNSSNFNIANYLKGRFFLLLERKAQVSKYNKILINFTFN